MKKIRNTGLLLAALLLFACEKKVEQPTLSDEKISRIMADFATAEAATNGLNGFPKDSLLQLYFGQVLEMHQITREEYEKKPPPADHRPAAHAGHHQGRRIADGAGGEKNGC